MVKYHDLRRIRVTPGPSGSWTTSVFPPGKQRGTARMRDLGPWRCSGVGKLSARITLFSPLALAPSAPVWSWTWSRVGTLAKRIRGEQLDITRLHRELA